MSADEAHRATYRDIRFEHPEAGILKVTLCRPHHLNAYTPNLCAELADAVRRYLHDDALRVMILTGEGRGFCTGGDVRGGDAEPRVYADMQMSHAQEMRLAIHPVYEAIARCDKPIIAMVNGVAVAGGLALALLCDLRIASDRARLGDTSGKFSLLPDEGGAWLFPRAMGLDKALRMTWYSEVYDAAQALELGLVTEVVPDDQLEARTMALARDLAERAPLAVRLAKNMMVRADQLTLEQSLGDAALSVMVSNAAEDVREGARAFREKRKPEFKGR